MPPDAKQAIRPQPGRQEAFWASAADIAIFGGAAGGGKSYALLLEALRHVGNGQFSAVIFRRTFTQVSNPGGLFDASRELYPLAGGQPKATPPGWRFPSGATVRFAHMQYEDDKLDWQGSQIALIGFDELTHFSQTQFFYMLSRNRSLCGVRPYVRATTNPDADSWVAKLLAWWIDPESGFPILDRAALLRGERQAASELVRAYGEVWRRIKGELDALLAERTRTERRGEPVDEGWLFQYGRLQALQNQVEGEIKLFAEFADPLITRQQGAAVDAALAHAEELAREQRGGGGEGQGGASTGSAPVQVQWSRLPREAVQGVIGFTADGSPLRALLDALGPAAGQAVRDELISGVALGVHPTQIARRVKAALGDNLVRALRISRTETLRAYREATFLSYQANDQVLDGWVWLSAATARTCAACWGLHGTVHPLSERQVDHPNGRCTQAPHLKGAQPVDIEAGEDQFARMEPAKQDAILGKAAGAAYRGGGGGRRRRRRTAAGFRGAAG